MVLYVSGYGYTVDENCSSHVFVRSVLPLRCCISRLVSFIDIKIIRLYDVILVRLISGKFQDLRSSIWMQT